MQRAIFERRETSRQAPCAKRSLADRINGELTDILTAPFSAFAPTCFLVLLPPMIGGACLPFDHAPARLERAGAIACVMLTLALAWVWFAMAHQPFETARNETLVILPVFVLVVAFRGRPFLRMRSSLTSCSVRAPVTILGAMAAVSVVTLVGAMHVVYGYAL